MALMRIHQVNESGCFIACVAILTGKSYYEAFQMLHPGKNIERFRDHNIIHESVEQGAIENLQKIGIQARPSRLRRLKSLVRHGKKPAMLIMRWKDADPGCHSVIFDPETKKILDPAFFIPLKFRTYERHLVGLLYIDQPTTQG
jgi:hypothetical protein